MAFHIAKEAGELGAISEPTWLESMDLSKKRWILASMAALATAAFIGANVYHGLTGSRSDHHPATSTTPKPVAPKLADLLRNK